MTRECPHRYSTDCCTQCDWEREKRVLRAAVTFIRDTDLPAPRGLQRHLAAAVDAYLKKLMPRKSAKTRRPPR